jgi:hypothetical protein
LKLAESSDDDNEDEEESGVKNEGGDVEMGDAATASS